MQGQCSCGETRYEMTDKPLYVLACHCTWCQRETGSAFATNAFIEADCVKLISGTLEVIDIPSKSGAGQRMHRCPTCKVALWSNYLGLGTDFSFVRVGTLNEPTQCPANIQIFTSTKFAWVQLNDKLPARDGYYNKDKYWSEDALKRFQAVIDARP